MKTRRTILAVVLLALASGASCARMHNRAYSLVMGKVSAQVGEHRVVVTDCYRTSPPAPETLTDPATGKMVYKYAPCRDAVIVIQDDKLTVNGKSYGQVKSDDRITVDHGQVLINGEPAHQVVAQQ